MPTRITIYLLNYGGHAASRLSPPYDVVRIKWTMLNQRDAAVYAFTPIAIVPKKQ